MRVSLLDVVLGCCVIVAAVPSQPRATIHEAARAGDLATVRALVVQDPAAVGARDDAGRTALQAASAAGRHAVVAYLLSRDGDVNAADNTGATALHLAAYAGQDEIARLLIEKKAAIDARNASGYTPLALACTSGSLAVATRLLAAGAAVEAANDYRRTPLLLVARESGNAELARVLLDHKANINARDRFLKTPLMLAAWRGFGPLVDLLIERGAAIPEAGPARDTLLRQAASSGLERLFSTLLGPGVNPPVDKPGTRSLLHEAASSGSVPIIRRLLASKPDLDAQDADGWTPLHDAAFMARLEAVKVLLDTGANANVRNGLGQSPWNLATEHERPDVAALLATRGADLGAPRFPALAGDYLGQQPPGRVPQPFAPHIVGGHFGVHGMIVFSPDGNEAYWSEMVPPTNPGYSTNRTMVSRRVDGRWTYPRIAMVGSRRLDDVPVLAADGKRIYDMSFRPLSGEADARRENIWVADRAGDGWSEPRPLERAVNAPPQHWQFGVDKDGGVYFASNWKGARGLFFSPMVNGRHSEPVPLPPSINATGDEAMPFIAANGSYLLFSRNYDIWVSFRGSDGRWLAPSPLPAPINTPDREICPVVSPDGRYLFFLRGWGPHWVDAAVIEELRPKTRSSIKETPERRHDLRQADAAVVRCVSCCIVG